MRILLSGSEKKRADLSELYNRALKEAKEFYIASAYLKLHESFVGQTVPSSG